MRSEAAAGHGRRLSMWAGTIGTALTAVGGLIYLPIPTDTRIAESGLIRALRALSDSEGLTLCFVGVSLLTVAWALLGVMIRLGHADLTAVKRSVWLWAVPLVVAPPLFSTDGWSYAADGFLDGHGSSPYVVTPSTLHGPIVQAVCPCWMNARAPYGPLSVLWGGVSSHLTSSPWGLMLSYRILALLGLAMLVWAAPRLAVLSGVGPAAATWLAVSPFVLVAGVGGMHLDLAMIGLVAVALAVTPARGWLFGAAMIGVAASIKAPAAVAGLGVVLLTVPSRSVVWRLAHAVRVGLVIAGTVAAIGLVGGLGFGWIGALRETLVLRTPLSLTFQARRLLHWLGVGAHWNVVDTVGVAVLAVALVVLLLRAPIGRPPSVLRTTALAMLLATVLSPVTNEWYYLWCVPLLASARLSVRLRGALTGFTTVLVLLAPLGRSFYLADMRSTILWVTVAGVLVGGVAGMALERAEERSTRPRAEEARR